MSTSKELLVLPCVESVVIHGPSVNVEVPSLEELHRVTEVPEMRTIFRNDSIRESLWLERIRARARAELAGRTR